MRGGPGFPPLASGPQLTIHDTQTGVCDTVLINHGTSSIVMPHHDPYNETVQAGAQTKLSFYKAPPEPGLVGSTEFVIRPGTDTTPFDLGFRCTPAYPEVRVLVPVSGTADSLADSKMSVTEDASSPTGLKFTIDQP